jgi:hypothetical protein
MLSNSANSQQYNSSPRQGVETYLEIQDDPYVPDIRADHPRTPAYRYSSSNIWTVQVNVDESGNNIVGDAANEPSITFDPNDPDKMAIGWRQFDNIGNNFRQAGYGFTEDGGQSWWFPEVIDPGVFRSDPVLCCDGFGNFYYNSLTVVGNSYFCNVYKSEDAGATWEMGTFAQGGDKQWMSVDRRTEGIGAGHIYAYWNSSYSICEPDFFTRSTDGNQSYEDCTDIPGNPIWGTSVVSDNGDLYIGARIWSGFRVAKSTNAKDPGQEVSWEYYSDVYLDGQLVGFGGYQCPNPSGLLGQTIITMDTTGGPYDGNIYVLASVERNSNSDPCDVMFSRSVDDGVTWSYPVRINKDANLNDYQWFGTMSVAPDGRIDVIWLDTRDNPGTIISALYYSYSLDGGFTWSEDERLSELFDPHEGWPNQDKMGDYFDMFSDEDGAPLAWAATFNGEQDVYYSLITPDYVGVKDEERPITNNISNSYPNPFSAKANIRYQLTRPEDVTLKIFSSTGEEIITLVDKRQGSGFHLAEFDATGLANGVYYYRLQTEDHTETGRMVLAK